MKKNRIKFQEYSEIPSSIDYVNYELNLQLQDHKFKIPFFFEEGYDIRMVEEVREREVVSICKEITNGKKLVIFGLDDNEYQIEEFNNLDEIKMGSNISVNKKGLKFSCKFVQEITIDFELNHDGLSSDIIKIIIDLYNEETLYFINR
jgi:hypothetical protein